MADDESLTLEALQRDLDALIGDRLTALDRLVQNLEAHLEDLRALVEKKPKNDASRNTLMTGKAPPLGCDPKRC